MTTTITSAPPIAGPAWDKSRPETRQPWMDFRAGGITATQIRDWGNASKRRQIIDEKISGVFEDLSHVPAIDHGNRREPVIAAWAQGKFGITPCENTFAHPGNNRHLASPDGISLDPFSKEILVGGPDAIVAEIKTSKHDLTPGILDAARVLVEIQTGSDFDRSGYYVQMQWQMYVMNSPMTLFLYEQHDNVIDAETGTFTPLGPPQWAFIPRDQALIDILVEKVAPKALAEIDAARMALRYSELPPASDFPAEDAILVADYVQSLDAESQARIAKERSWKTLNKKYVGPGKPDMHKVDVGVAYFTVSTSTPTPKAVTRTVVDEEAMRRRAPKLVAQYEALRERFTSEVTEIEEPEPKQRITITPKKEKP